MTSGTCDGCGEWFDGLEQHYAASTCSPTPPPLGETCPECGNDELEEHRGLARCPTCRHNQHIRED